MEPAAEERSAAATPASDSASEAPVAEARDAASPEPAVVEAPAAAPEAAAPAEARDAASEPEPAVVEAAAPAPEADASAPERTPAPEAPAALQALQAPGDAAEAQAQAAADQEEHGYLADPAGDDLDYEEDLVVYELSPDPAALRAARGRACVDLFSSQEAPRSSAQSVSPCREASLQAASVDEILLEDATACPAFDDVWREEPSQWSPLAKALFPEAAQSPVKDSAELATSPVRERAAQAARRALQVVSAAYQDAASLYTDEELWPRSFDRDEAREEDRGLCESPCQIVRRTASEIRHSDSVVRSIDFVKIQADAARGAAEEAARRRPRSAAEVREAAQQAKDKAELLGGLMKEKAVIAQAKLCDAAQTAKAQADLARVSAEALSAKAEVRAKHVAFRAEVALDSLGAKCAQLHTEVTSKVHKAEEIASEVSVQVAPVIEKAKGHAVVAKSFSVAVKAQVSEKAQRGFGVAVEKAKVARQASSRFLSSPGGA